MVSITNYLPQEIKQNIRHPRYALKVALQNLFTAFSRRFLGSHSQHGEDIILFNLLKKAKKGFYIDVGANDPEIISNTKYFYDKGWSGINIEPHPVLFGKIRELRKNDININAGIACQEGSLKFYRIDETRGTAGSTFDPAIAEELKQKGYKLSEVIEMPVIPLKKVFDDNLGERKIDFMSVDTEGFDLEVLKSNDWDRYRPTFILVETVNDRENIVSYMKEQNYKVIFENTANAIFKDGE
jgi:FkbM family methyltransferase